MQTFLVKSRLVHTAMKPKRSLFFAPCKTSASFFPESQRVSLLHSRSQGQSVIQLIESEEKARYTESVCPQSRIRRYYHCSQVQEYKLKHKY